uniref:Secreted protein n=1 Tax=Setaria digitata TaxID=48799 RepID=A0A915PSN1_9BILA
MAYWRWSVPRSLVVCRMFWSCQLPFLTRSAAAAGVHAGRVVSRFSNQVGGCLCCIRMIAGLSACARLPRMYT